MSPTRPKTSSQTHRAPHIPETLQTAPDTLTQLPASIPYSLKYKWAISQVQEESERKDQSQADSGELAGDGVRWGGDSEGKTRSTQNKISQRPFPHREIKRYRTPETRAGFIRGNILRTKSIGKFQVHSQEEVSVRNVKDGRETSPSTTARHNM